MQYLSAIVMPAIGGGILLFGRSSGRPAVVRPVTPVSRATIFRQLVGRF